MTAVQLGLDSGRRRAHADRKLSNPRPATQRAALRVATRVISALLLTAAVLVLLGVTVGPRLLHYRTVTMLTASMSPGIKPGDVILDTQVTAKKIKVGQILTYHIPVDDHRVVSHRVIEVERTASGAVTFRTKGDANVAADPWTATLQGEQAWQVRAVVPYAGSAIRTLRTPVAHMMLTGLVPALLVGWLLISIWSPKQRP